MVSTDSSPRNSSPKESASVLRTFLTAVLAVLALAATALPGIEASQTQTTYKSQSIPTPIGYWNPSGLAPKN